MAAVLVMYICVQLSWTNLENMRLYFTDVQNGASSRCNENHSKWYQSQVRYIRSCQSSRSRTECCQSIREQNRCYHYSRSHIRYWQSNIIYNMFFQSIRSHNRLYQSNKSHTRCCNSNTPHIRRCLSNRACHILGVVSLTVQILAVIFVTDYMRPCLSNRDQRQSRLNR